MCDGAVRVTELHVAARAPRPAPDALASRDLQDRGPWQTLWQAMSPAASVPPFSILSRVSAPSFPPFLHEAAREV